MGFLEKPDWPDTSYDSKINNIVTEFFIPALKESIEYRRLAGFFHSKALSVLSPGLKHFIEKAMQWRSHRCVLELY